MSFTNSGALILLLLLPLCGGLLYWRERVRSQKLARIGDSALMRELVSLVSDYRRRWKIGLWAGAIVALILALARPVWGVDAEVIESQGVAVIVVLDVSASMDAGDMTPSRLERAKLNLRDLFAALEGNELGLILFAGEAFIQFPLTSDVNSANTFLDAVSSASISRQGSSIEAALNLAMDTFDERIAAHSVIVLISDGENQEGDPLIAAQLAEERGITIHTIGYGGFEGVPIPYFNDAGLIEFKADKAGKVVMSQLDEEALVAIAGQTGGLYLHASGSSEDMLGLASQINAIEGDILESTLTNRPIERFGIFVLLALLALSAEILLPETRGGTI